MISRKRLRRLRDSPALMLLLRRVTWGVSVCALLCTLYSQCWVPYLHHKDIHQLQFLREYASFESVRYLKNRAEIEAKLANWRPEERGREGITEVVYRSPRKKCYRYTTCYLQLPHYIVVEYPTNRPAKVMGLGD